MFRLRVIILLVFISQFRLSAQSDQKIMIIIIDGARYSETFGNPGHHYIPRMWELADEGTIVDSFYNNGITYTSKAIPALWCGTWTAVKDTIYNGVQTSYAEKPTIFEYYRKGKQAPEVDCFYVLPYIPDLWLPSFDVDYGPEYWPTFYSYGENDDDVAENTKFVIDNYHPHFLWVYLSDVDHGGHTGNWGSYIAALSNADQIVGELWDYLQADPFYQSSTTLIVTNDHGRHDDDHGGFQGHGCGCVGCRHIQFLAVGPDIKPGNISTTYRTIPDLAVTAAHILGVDSEKATGNVMQEIFEASTIKDLNQNQTLKLSVSPNPVSASSMVKFNLQNNSEIYFELSDIFGRTVGKSTLGIFGPGEHTVHWMELGFLESGATGIFFLTIKTKAGTSTQKIVFGEN